MSDYKKAKSVAQAIDIESRYQHIRPRPQMPDFAAVIDGVDLTKPISSAVQEELYRALLDFEVLFFEPQQISEEQHLALASAFGEVAQGAYFPRKDGHPQIEVLANDEARPASVDHWHTDLSWLETPPTGTVIQITELPEVGGNTAWMSLSKAFKALSPGLQEYLRGLTASHTWEVSQWRNYLANLGEDVLINSIRQYKPVQHPVVLTHPESGKEILFVNETFTRNIEGVSGFESRQVLQLLANWIKQPEFTYSHKWQKNGLAVWDNRSTQHYALADYWPRRRVNQRVTFNARGTQSAQANTLDAVGALGRTSKVAYGL
ncbi:TauD/TfdA dioxygenase family protein [Pseudomonas wenzhouensis]|uniref:TauD/TfdA dioxygenase family protein n=1 Tax=Pseudomonas wenzhouensis TaxID=2906062 RepID=UPI001E4D8FF6|nr:TauD/TfdA family dioxygenase [Pseudomonas wenzhouensis]UFQ98954.1 TauD/TfdA family dioxygenase [Pseudomonas wenzhouensis]